MAKERMCVVMALVALFATTACGGAETAGGDRSAAGENASLATQNVAAAEPTSGQSAEGAESTDSNSAAMPLANCLNSARFEGRIDPIKDAILSAVNGRPFKASPTKADVESSLKDANGKYAMIFQSERIAVPDTLSRRAVLMHNKNDPNVHVRAKCADDTWSDWVPVR